MFAKRFAIETKLLDPRLKENPLKYATPGAAGIDLVAAIHERLYLYPGQAVLVPTGIAIHIADPNYMAVILPRSGLGHKMGVVLGNGVGLIDSDYQGQVMMSLLNRTAEEFIAIDPMMRVAQLVFMPVVRANLIFVDQFSDESDRGAGGFGSTGK